MAILAGDLKIVASQIMDDVPEGGGAPTSVVVGDGVSNAIFPDVSELDRAGGRVNLRKVHVHVQTDDRDTLLGSNIIVAEPPADPNVSITLFTNDSTFDRRTEASSRVESYLNKGPQWPGILYENHIAGQRSIQILQDTKTELPTIGKTLVLVQNETLSNEFLQYVRATDVNSVVRTFYDENGNSYEKAVVTLSISDALRTDFKGSPVSKQLNKAVGACWVRDTIVADAGTYVGVTPLTAAADLGDFTVTAETIFSQLVPSAQTETPISDVRANGLSTALVATGGAVTQTVTLAFTTSQELFLGGPVYPGTLSITRSGTTLVDQAGLLVNGDAEVGQVDYDNGIASLSIDVWGPTGGSHVVTFVPAAVPDLISDQHAIRVTAESRSLSYAYTLNRPPLRRTVSISYLAQGRWYVLRDNGAGALEGASSSHGAGTVNYTTGSISVTLGALPDVGGAIVTQSYTDLTTVEANNSVLQAAYAYVAFNTSGQLGEGKGATSIARRTLIVNWQLEGVTKYVYDAAGVGTLSGDGGTGTVDYSNGVIRVYPTVLPPPGTVFVAATIYIPPILYYGLASGGYTPASTPTTYNIDRAEPWGG